MKNWSLALGHWTFAPRRWSLALGLWTLLLALVCQPAVAASPEATQAVTSSGGMVVSVSPEASDAGAAMLQQGGNAVDAAVATAMALAVTYPAAGNIGGGGFMMVWRDGAEPECIEYRETAPAAANRDTFVDQTDRFSAKVVGVPGTVRGMALAHQRHGKLPWKTVLAPAIALANEGFVIEQSLARALNGMLKQTDDFPEFQRVYGKRNGRQWKEGDRLVQPELAATLTLLAEEGPDAFYTGRIAERIVADLQSDGGLMTLDDLAAYKAHVRRPIHGTYRGYDIYGPPPPSSGGTTLVEMLNILENFDLGKHARYSPETLHLMIETMRRAYLDRARFLGDPAFTDVPGYLTSKAHAKELAASIDLDEATASESLADDILLPAESNSTTHFSVVDGRGMAVSNTYTLQMSYGSRRVVSGMGFLLNNEMTDFNWVPGLTDDSGRIGTQANLVAPGKRMLSSQSPTLVARDGRLVLVTGSPGGRTIVNTALNMVVNVIDFEMDIRAAVDAPRLHHQWLPDVVRFEGADEEEHAGTVAALRSMGHKVSGHLQGDAHSILLRDGVAHGAADMRRARAKATPVPLK